MSESIHIPLESLVARARRKINAVAATAAQWRSAASFDATSQRLGDAGGRKKFLYRDLWLPDERPRLGESRGRARRSRIPQVEKLADADLIFYNTCSIREKAAQKVFSRLGEFRGTPGENKIIGVLGCLAQQEGEDIFERAPWVSLVCGSASYRKLPDFLAQLESGGRRVMGLDLDTDETFETELTRRDNPFRAYLTIIEGCDYACSYCVVPHTRGPERSRRSDAVLAEVRRLADLGYSEIQLLGQTVNSYRDPGPRKLNFVGACFAKWPRCQEFAACASRLRIPTISRATSCRPSMKRPRSAITFICRCSPARRRS